MLDGAASCALDILISLNPLLRGVVADDSTLLAEDGAKTGGAVLLGKTREADG